MKKKKKRKQDLPLLNMQRYLNFTWSEKSESEEDTITTELIKNAGTKCQMRIYNLILKIWESERMPKEWKSGIIVSIHKKESRLECSNYRFLTLLNIQDIIETHQQQA